MNTTPLSRGQFARSIPAAPLGTLLLCGFLAMAVIACWPRASRAQAQQPGQNKGPVTLLQFKLKRTRMFPAQREVLEGRYLIEVTNPLIVADMEIALYDGSGNRAGSRGLSKHSSSVRVPVDLRPGKYSLRVTGVPMWQAEIVVHPK